MEGPGRRAQFVRSGKGFCTARACAAGPRLTLALSDEKNLSTSQSPTQKGPRLSRPHGECGRTQRAQAAAGEGTPAACGHDSAQAARLRAGAPRQGLGAANRLRHSHDFLLVQRQGTRFSTPHFVLYGLKLSESDPSRLGITASRRIGGAVVRNRLKRRVRECFRLSLRELVPRGTALVVIAREGAGALDGRELFAELERAAAGLAGRLRNPTGDDGADR